MFGIFDSLASYRRMMEARDLRPKDIAAWTGLSCQKVTALADLTMPPPEYWPPLAWGIGISRQQFARELHALARSPMSTLQQALANQAQEERASLEAGSGI